MDSVVKIHWITCWTMYGPMCLRPLHMWSRRSWEPWRGWESLSDRVECCSIAYRCSDGFKGYSVQKIIQWDSVTVTNYEEGILYHMGGHLWGRRDHILSLLVAALYICQVVFPFKGKYLESIFVGFLLSFAKVLYVTENWNKIWLVIILGSVSPGPESQRRVLEDLQLHLHWFSGRAHSTLPKNLQWW